MSYSNRITWLDASRGLAILLLIMMHYVGALESRSFISKDVLDIMYGLLRLATPFFIFTFGLAIFVTASKKLDKIGLANYYVSNVFKRMGYILLGREIIVIILAVRYPTMAENLGSILLFQEFSKGGEILLFYFLAFLIAPLNVLFIQRVNIFIYCITWLIVYSISFYIGTNYISYESNHFLRLLFYDIYPFFPFLIVLAAATISAKYFLTSSNRQKYLQAGLLLGIVLFLSGLYLFSLIVDDVWSSLSRAEYKRPPHPFYLIFYLGEICIVICSVALMINKIPKLIDNILSLLGRNTLVSYVVHYSFFIAVPVAAFIGGGTVSELLLFLVLCALAYLGIKRWDRHKSNKRERQKIKSS